MQSNGRASVATTARPGDRLFSLGTAYGLDLDDLDTAVVPAGKADVMRQFLGLTLWTFHKAPEPQRVVRPPSGLGITLGSPPSMTATHEFVVPRSIPIVFAMSITSPFWVIF